MQCNKSQQVYLQSFVAIFKASHLIAVVEYYIYRNTSHCLQSSSGTLSE